MRNKSSITHLTGLIDRGFNSEAENYAIEHGFLIVSNGVFFKGADCYLTRGYFFLKEEIETNEKAKAEIDQLSLEIYDGDGDVYYIIDNENIEHEIADYDENTIVIKLPSNFKASRELWIIRL